MMNAAKEDATRLGATLQAELDEAHMAREKESVDRELAVSRLQSQLAELKASLAGATLGKAGVEGELRILQRRIVELEQAVAGLKQQETNLCQDVNNLGGPKQPGEQPHRESVRFRGGSGTEWLPAPLRRAFHAGRARPDVLSCDSSRSHVERSLRASLHDNRLAVPLGQHHASPRSRKPHLRGDGIPGSVPALHLRLHESSYDG
jgi:hypothetical protein